MRTVSPIAAVIAAVVHLLTLAGLGYLAAQERRTRAQAHALRCYLDNTTANVRALTARVDLDTAERAFYEAFSRVTDAPAPRPRPIRPDDAR